MSRQSGCAKRNRRQKRKNERDREENVLKKKKKKEEKKKKKERERETEREREKRRRRRRKFFCLLLLSHPRTHCKTCTQRKFKAGVYIHTCMTALEEHGCAVVLGAYSTKMEDDLER